VDAGLSALPHSAQVAVGRARRALDRAQRALATKQQIADRADRRRIAADARAGQLQARMAAVKYAVRL
jgi:hypothetical protein